jgi:hypothetical protein
METHWFHARCLGSTRSIDQIASPTFTFLELATGHSLELFRKCWCFSNISILCVRWWWMKLLVCFKTLIYCGHLCYNAGNYPFQVPLYAALGASSPWMGDWRIQYWPKVTNGPAHFLRARSARHLQYTNGRHTRDKRVRCSYDARMSRICCANVTRMPRECCADVMRIQRRCQAYVAQMGRASYARHSRSKCDVKRASHGLHPAWEVRFLAWVTFGQYCTMHWVWYPVGLVPHVIERVTNSHWRRQSVSYLTLKLSNIVSWELIMCKLSNSSRFSILIYCSLANVGATQFT